MEGLCVCAMNGDCAGVHEETFAVRATKRRAPARLAPMALSFMPLKNVSRILIESSVAQRRGGKAWGFNPRNSCMIRASEPPRGGGDAVGFHLRPPGGTT